MSDTKITSATDITTLASTDVIPVGRPGNTTAYKATMDEVKTYAAPGFNVKQYGAVGNGVADDTAAIQAAATALLAVGGGGTLYFPNGTYSVSDTLNLKNLTYVTIQGDHALISARTGANFTGKAIVDMGGVTTSTIQGLRISCGLTANQPVAGLAIGRTATSTGGSCVFIGCQVSGKYTSASFYDICVESNCYYKCFFQSETALPAYYTASIDPGGMGYTLSSNIDKVFHSCSFLNYSGVAGSAAVKLEQAVYEVAFNHCFYYIPTNGAAFEFVGHAVSGSPQNIFITEGRVEGAGGADSVLVRNTVTQLTYLQVKSITWAIASDFVISLDTNMSRCVFDFLVPVSATKYIHVKPACIMATCYILGSVVGGIQVDFDGSAVQNICLFQAGFPYSGNGYYEYDGGLNSHTNISLVTDSISYNNYISASSMLRRTAALVNGDTSPSVKGHDLFWSTNVSPTSITTFDDGNPGQEIKITFTTGNTTLVHSAGLTLAGSGNVTPTAGSVISLIYDAGYGVWRETGRTIA